MKLVDKQNHIFGLHDFAHDRLEPLLKLAAILGARNQRTEIKGDKRLP